VGCVGYCMSGPFSFAMAGTFPDRIKAAASIYGVRLYGEGSPAHLASQVRGELYFACAELDDYAPREMIEGLAKHLDDVDANARVEWYPGAHHGFAFPKRPVYDKPSAERHWERLIALFRRRLG
jgi:carboxymethylenebutenolidase